MNYEFHSFDNDETSHNNKPADPQLKYTKIHIVEITKVRTEYFSFDLFIEFQRKIQNVFETDFSD